MPQILLAGAVIAGAWFAARLMRKALARPSARRPADEAVIPLRRDPETGIYSPVEND